MSKSLHTRKQPKTRSYVAISAHFATGAGTHGGGKRAKARKDRASARQSLKRGDWASV